MYSYNLTRTIFKVTVKLVCLILLSACNLIDQTNKSKEKETNVEALNIQRINFFTENDLIIIPISIEGQEYRFLFDTGSPTLISLQLSKKLNLTQQKQIKTVDSQGNSQRLNYVKINEVTIKNAIFNNINAGVVDFKQTPAIACLSIDGVVGANIIRKYCWQIDYVNQQLLLARNASLLLKNAQTKQTRYCIPFSVDANGTPIISVKIKDTEIKDFKMDTGSVGFISIDKDYYSELNENNTILKQRTSYGANLVGLFGAAENDTLKQLLITELTVGEKLSLIHQTIDLRPTNLSLMGNAFLRNFCVTIDSENNCLLLEPLAKFHNTYYHTFGISFKKEETNIVVSMITENSPAQDYGLQVGDTILQINGLDVTKSIEDSYCQIIRWMRNKEIDVLSLKWLKNGLKNECKLYPLPALSVIDMN